MTAPERATDPVAEFGRAEPGVDYRDRPCAFGVVERDGQIACVRVDRGDRSYYDLPGGAIDGDETEQEALIREFVEETGLAIRPLHRLGGTRQRFFRSTGEAVRNLAGVWAGEAISHDPDAKVEDDHELVWLDPVEALVGVRHEAHAWALALWLRTR